MPPRLDRQVRAQNLLTLADGLRQSCEKLKGSVASLVGKALDETGDSCLGHLQRTDSLRQEVSRKAVALQQRQNDASGLSPPLKEQLRVIVDECRRLLEEASAAYSTLTSNASARQAEIEERLLKIRLGSKALGGYRQAARVEIGG